MKLTSMLAALALGVAAASAPALLAAAAAPAPPPGRVVILGFDGVDATLVEQMLAAGQLPALSALRERGGYSPLTPTVPAQTPVSWATFSTGLDPGGHEIFDFLKRDPANRIPTFAVAEEKSVPLLFGKKNPAIFAAAGLALFLLPALFLFARRRRVAGAILVLLGLGAGTAAFLAVRAWLPTMRPWVQNNRRGPVFWSEPSARPATVIRMPVTFPPEAFPDGRMLSGLGVPDVSGRIGRPAYFTSDPFFAPREGNDFSVEIVRLESNVGRQEVRVVGPPGRPFGREGSIDTTAEAVGPRRPGPHPRRGRDGSRGAASRGVERLGPSRLSRQPARRDPRVRAPPARLDSARDRPLPLADPVRPRAPASRLHAFLAARVREGARARVRPLQDDGLGHRHLVHPVGHASRRRVPRRRPHDRGAGAEDAARAPRRQGAPSLPLLRVPRPRGARFLAVPRPGASGLRRRAGGEVRRRGREVLPHDGRDRGRDGEGAEARRRSPRALRPRLRDVAAVGQLQLLARRERLPRPEGRRTAPEPRGALLARPVLGGDRLDEVEGLRDGPRRHLRQSLRTGERRHRRARRRVRGAAPRAHRPPDGA